MDRRRPGWPSCSCQQEPICNHLTPPLTPPCWWLSQLVGSTCLCSVASCSAPREQLSMGRLQVCPHPPQSSFLPDVSGEAGHRVGHARSWNSLHLLADFSPRSGLQVFEERFIAHQACRAESGAGGSGTTVQYPSLPPSSCSGRVTIPGLSFLVNRSLNLPGKRRLYVSAADLAWSV